MQQRSGHSLPGINFQRIYERKPASKINLLGQILKMEEDRILNV